MRKTTKTLAALAIVTALTGFATASKAADSVLEANVVNYLQKDTVAKDIHGMLHTGSTYLGTKNLGTFDVTDSGGRKVPGEFAIKIRHQWSAERGSNDHTDVFYFFNDKGRFKGLRVDNTTAIFNQPFTLSGIVIETVKELLIKEVRNHPNSEQLTKLIRSADAKGLLELRLALGQP